MTINVKMLVNRQGPAGVIYAAGSSYDIEETLAHRFVSSNAALYTSGAMPFDSGGVPVMGKQNLLTGGIELSVPRSAVSQAHKNAALKFPGIVWSDPSGRVVGDYQIVGAGSSGAMDAAIIRAGITSSLRVNCNRGSAAATDVNILHSTPPVLVPTARVGVWVYIPDYTLITSIVPKVSFGDTSYTNGKYQTYNITADLDKQYNGWHFVAFDLAEYGGTYGTVDAATTTVNAVKLTINQSGATAAPLYVGKWIVGWQTKARIMLTADDGYASWFSRGIPILDSLGLKSTSSIIAAQIDTNSSWATSAQLESAYANGHDLCAHGAASLATLGGEAAIYADVKLNIDYLAERGYGRALSYYVYPNGVYQLSAGDQTIINILKSLGMKMARGTVNPRWMKVPDGFSDAKWNQPIIGAGGAVSVATIKGYIDNLITYGALGNLMLHDITLSGATSGTLMNHADFYEIAKYIADKVSAGLLIDVTASEVLATI